MRNVPLKLWETFRRLVALPFHVCAVVAMIVAAAAALVGAGVPWYLASVIAPPKVKPIDPEQARGLFNLGQAIGILLTQPGGDESGDESGDDEEIMVVAGSSR